MVSLLSLAVFSGWVVLQDGIALQIATIGTLLFGLNVLLVWLRLKTGSLWPPVLFHALHNFLAFNPVTLGSTHQPWLSGKSGLALACGYLAICVGSLWDGSRERLAPTQGNAGWLEPESNIAPRRVAGRNANASGERFDLLEVSPRLSGAEALGL